jgi:hypothetical protein
VTAFPVSPPAAGEQLALPLEGTLAGRYAAWRQTADGLRVFLEIERRVLARANRGDERVEINDVTADLRQDWAVAINNSWRALISRELLARHAFLRGKIETRRRRAV